MSVTKLTPTPLSRCCFHIRSDSQERLGDSFLEIFSHENLFQVKKFLRVGIFFTVENIFCSQEFIWRSRFLPNILWSLKIRKKSHEDRKDNQHHNLVKLFIYFTALFIFNASNMWNADNEILENFL